MRKQQALIVYFYLLLAVSPALFAAQTANYYPQNPLTANTTYCVSSQRLQCFNAQTQQLLWQNTAIKSARGLLLINGKLFVNLDHSALILDAHNGKTLARWDNEGTLFDPVVSANRLILSDQQGWLRVIDLASGQTMWRRKIESSWVYPPAVVGSVLISGGRDGQLSAVDIDTGRVRWRKKIGQELVYRPVAVAGKVFVSSFDGYLRAIDPASAAVISSTHLDSPVFNIQTDGKDTLVAAGYNGNLYAVDAATARLRWQQPVATSLRFAFSLDKDQVSSIDYQGQFYLLDKANGRLLQHFRFAGTHHIAPLMTSSRIRLFPADMPVINIPTKSFQSGIGKTIMHHSDAQSPGGET